MKAVDTNILVDFSALEITKIYHYDTIFCPCDPGNFFTQSTLYMDTPDKAGV